MIIVRPPLPVAGPYNLRKHSQFFNMVYNTLFDRVAVPAALHEWRQYARLAHSAEHLAAVDYHKRNGWGLPDGEGRIRDYVMTSVGSEVAAVAAVLDNGGVACAPVSGFHHAKHDSCGGYCTLNGLVIAALYALGRDVHKVLILDGDAHYGDGTEDILQVLGIPKSRIENVDMRGLTLQRMEGLVAKSDLVLYQAGADAHVDDSYNAGYLSTRGFRRRDLAVFKACKAHNVPVVWNLAGGYNDPGSTLLHVSTFNTACAVYEPDRLCGAPAPGSDAE